MLYVAQVKDNPVPSDSLLTLDLKSGSKVNIGTHAVTLEKFFDGQLKAQRWLDIGNGEVSTQGGGHLVISLYFPQT